MRTGSCLFLFKGGFVVGMYKVRYRVMDDHEMLISGDNEEEAKDHALLAIDPDNQHDWSVIIGVEKIEEVK